MQYFTRLTLAFLWLPAFAALVVAAWRGNGNKIGDFLGRHGSLIASIVSTGVTAIGVVAA